MLSKQAQSALIGWESRGPRIVKASFKTKKLAGKYSKPERPNRWIEHFKEFLNRPASLNPLNIEAARTDLPIDVTQTTIEEIRMAIRQMESGKTTALDNLQADALKSHIEITANILHALFRKIWEED
ncbi:unnamed protein product [Schistosoma curassoni]|uniref:Integrase n=1 Tax=Schistosoma curassoni TaxID=6186 RepID=A0A183JD06_9TREM|nr:unnamed protein product [Schistosoma curassoni]